MSIFSNIHAPDDISKEKSFKMGTNVNVMEDENAMYSFAILMIIFYIVVPIVFLIFQIIHVILFEP
jgi:hypothetical protein